VHVCRTQKTLFMKSFLLRFALLLAIFTSSKVVSAQAPCSTITPVTCAAITNVTLASGAGSFNPTCSGVNELGKEAIYSYTATTTGMHSIAIMTNNNTSNMSLLYMDSTLGCTGGTWTCINNGFLFNPIFYVSLNAGTTYFFMFDRHSDVAAASVFSFQLDCPEPAFDACASITTLSCGLTSSAVSINPGLGKIEFNCSGQLSYGKEQIFEYTATTSGLHNLSVMTNNNADFMSIKYKDAAGGCNNTGWTCLEAGFLFTPMYYINLTAGTTYYIMFDRTRNSVSNINTTETFSVRIDCPEPAYDACASVIPLTCGVTTALVNIDAGLGDIEFNCSNQFSYGKEQLFQYTATTTGTHSLAIMANNNADFMGLKYKDAAGGCNSTGWTCVDAGLLFNPIYYVNLTAGTTYYFLLDRNRNSVNNITNTETFSLRLDCPEPAYDACVSIVSLSCGVASSAVSIPPGLGDIDFNCSGQLSHGKEQIFQFTATSSGSHALSVSTNNNGDFMSLRYKDAAGGCNSTGWTCVDAGLLFNPIYYLNLTAGTTYYIMFDRNLNGVNNLSTTETFSVQLDCPEPAYDACANIIPLSCGVQSATIDILPGLGDIQFNCSGQVSNGKEQLFQFTALTTGLHSFAITTNNNGDFMSLRYKDAASGCNNTLWTCVDAGLLFNPIYYLNLTAGSTYYIILDRNRNGVSNINTTETFSVLLDCPDPAFDACGGITPITCGTSNSVSIAGGLGDIEFNCSGQLSYGKEAIFSYTPVLSGTHSIQITANNNGDFMSLRYKDAASGCNATGWTCIDGSFLFTPTYNVNLTAGVTYYFVFDRNRNSVANLTTTETFNFTLTCPLPGLALNFDGSNDYVDIGDINSIDNATALTVEAWIKPTTVTGSTVRTITSKWEDVCCGLNKGFMFAQYNNQLQVGFKTSEPIRSTNANMFANNWYHVAFVFDGTQTGNNNRLKVYINGNLATLDFSTYTVPASITGVDLLSATIGALRAPGGTFNSYFNGTMDEVRIWNEALCQSDIQARTGCQLTGTEPNLTAYYNFNQGIAASANPSVTTLLDGAGSADNGTLINFALTGATSNWVTPGGSVTGTCSPIVHATWYEDFDNDTYGNPSVILVACTQPSGYVSNGNDCQDTDPLVHTSETWYLDADADGYYVNTQPACGSPGIGWTNILPANGAGDCDDNVAAIHVPNTFYIDFDNDGFGSTSTAQICAVSPPLGYSTNNTDCNDNDNTVHTPQSYYVDADHDGFGSTTTALVCASSAPIGYSTNNTDCNDNDGSVNTPQLYYVDGDNDGFGSTITAMICASTAPIGYSTNNTDCNDGNNAIHSTITYYVDVDNDGFGSTTTAQLCSSAAPAGYSTNNTDCNDADGTVHAPQLYYVDSDHDGFGSSTIAFICSSTPPVGYSSNSDDCNDNNNAVSPGSLPVISYTNVSPFIGSIVSPTTGTPYDMFHFQINYSDADNDLPVFTYPKLLLDYEGNGVYTDLNDRVVMMQASDPADNNVVDGKIYYADLNGLQTGNNWKISVQATDASGCSTTFGPFTNMQVVDSLNIHLFANDITFSDPHPNPGDVITINARIHNETDFDAVNFYAHMVNLFDNLSQPDIFIPFLAAHDTVLVTWTLTTPLVPAWCPIQINVDHTNVLTETSENDNSAIRPFINGNYNLPGDIVCYTNVTPSCPYATQVQYITVSGSCYYTGTAVPLVDSSCAGATVSFALVETGESFWTYSNSNGFFSYTFLAPQVAGNYHLDGQITDYTITGDWEDGFCLIPPPCLPDLITNLDLNPNLICTSGSAVGTVSVTNAGCAPVTIPTLLGFSQFGGTPTINSMVVPPLAPNQTWTAPVGPITYNTVGNYGITAIADYNNQVYELSENNNAEGEPINVVICKPNLSIEICEGFDVSPVNPQFPGTIGLHAIVRNNGLSPAYGPFVVRFVYSGGTFDYTFTGTLNVGDVFDATVTVAAPPHATSSLNVKVDANFNVDELDETDNERTDDMCFEFQPVPLCAINFWQMDLVKQHPYSLAVGLHAEHLYDADPVQTLFEISGPGLPSGFNILGVATNNNVEMSCYCPVAAVLPTAFAFPDTGWYQVRFTVDPSDGYIECNEGNNVMTVNVHVVDKPDMRILSQFINPSALNPDVNEPITFEVSYENIGYQNVAQQMELYIRVDNDGLDSIYPVIGLNTGDHATYTFTTPWSSSTPGLHVIRAIIDNDHQIAELDELNNEATRSIVVGQSANLHFLNFEPSNHSPNIGEVIQLTSKIGNSGDIECNAQLQLSYINNSADTVDIITIPVYVNANDSSTYSFNWTVADNSTELLAYIINSDTLEYTYDDNDTIAYLGGIDISIVTSPASCLGEDDGTATASVTGGTPPYIFVWSNGIIGTSITDGNGNYTVTVYDNGGMQFAKSANIGVVPDNTLPIISNVPATINYTATDGVCPVQITWPTPTVSDNCPGVVLTSNHTPGDLFPTGSTLVTYTATDAAGNVSTAGFSVNIVGLPLAYAGADKTVCSNDTLEAFIPTYGTGTWTVASGTATFADSHNAHTLVSGLSNGANKLVWTVVNGTCGTASDTVTITKVCGGVVLTWNGIVSTNWHTATNWSPNQIPTALDSVIIPLRPHQPVISANAACKGIRFSAANVIVTVNAGVILAINGNITGNTNAKIQGNGFTEVGGLTQELVGNLSVTNLRVNGNLTLNNSAATKLDIITQLLINGGTLNTNGKLFMKSNAAGTANIGPIHSGTINGNVTQERYIPAGPIAYEYLAAGVAGQTINGLRDDITVTFGVPASVQWYKESLPGDKTANGWTSFVNANSTIPAYQGLAAYMYARPKTVDFLGSAYQGNINIPVTYTASGLPAEDGFNLVANPYISDINWDAASGWTRTNIDPTIYILNPLTNNNVTYNYVTNIGTGGFDGKVANGQAFFVQATAPGAVLAVGEDVKTVGATFFKQDEQLSTYMRIKVTGENGNGDEMILGFSGNATEYFDKEVDAPKIPNRYVDMALVAAKGEKLTQQFIAATTESTIIPVSFNTNGETGKFIISFENGSGIEQAVYLRDNLLGILTDVHQGTVYAFEVNTTNISSNENRFDLVIGEPAVKINPEDLTVVVFPNPANDKFSIAVEGLQSAAQLKVYDFTGKLVYEQEEVNNNRYTINSSEWESGVYMVEVKSAATKITKRISISK
jgi:hypothetical protein